MSTKVCRGCKGPLCPYCGGCIQEGECSCYSEAWESPIDGLGERELEQRTIRHAEELKALQNELLAACERVLILIKCHQVYDKDAQSILEQVIAKAKSEASNE